MKENSTMESRAEKLAVFWTLSAYNIFENSSIMSYILIQKENQHHKFHISSSSIIALWNA